MDLDFSEEQVMLRDTVRRLCEGLFDGKAVRGLETEQHKFNRPFWDGLATSGLCALRIEERHGGAGMGALDLAILFEEFGRCLASSPYLQSCLLAARILSAAAPAIGADYLPGIATGEQIVIPICSETGQGPFDASRGVVDGEALVLPFASVADMFLVASADGSGWALIPADRAGITITAQDNYASQPLFSVRFENVPVDAALSFTVPQSFAPASEAFSDVLIAAAAEAIGASERLLELTVDYANQRNQFGKPIASFQAISHPLAECATELEGIRHIVYQAAWASDEGQDCGHLARIAKLQAAALFRRLATLSVQVHGGIGYSTEGQPQLFYRRAKYHELMNGGTDELKRKIADHVLA